MKDPVNSLSGPVDRRSFMKKGLTTASTAALGAALVTNSSLAFAEQMPTSNGSLVPGDAAILRFLAAVENLETDFWGQYNELAGIQDSEVPGGSGNPAFTSAIRKLDPDMAQYIHDNTDNEFSHFRFINAYLRSKGVPEVDLSKFRTLPGSAARGSSGRKRITNLTQLTVDTSWWTRYRDTQRNPDLSPNFKFAQAVPDLAVNQHPTIPRTNADVANANFLQAIANSAAFHFATVEQGGTTLYPALAQRVTDAEVLRILLSIGPIETMQFQIWQEKAGKAPPLRATDPVTGVKVHFPNLNIPTVGQEFQANLILPEPCPFISPNLPKCSVIRPTGTEGIAAGVVQFLTNMGMFIGQSPEFFALLNQLATEADSAQRVC